MKPRAVVFAYHNVGVRCLQVLLARGVDVALVVTHEDNPNENIWFGSVASVAAEHGIPVVTPAEPADPALRRAVSDAQPDFIFSFYYRPMLPVHLLAIAPKGAYNMHGSLLPKYPRRVPTHAPLLNGERDTGPALHPQSPKPDPRTPHRHATAPTTPAHTPPPR
ncbi:formyltransferase, partial [Burkholderia contaminans]